MLGPADLTVAEGVNTIAYAWGSLEDGNLALATQTVEGLHSSPSGVPAGLSGLAADAPSSPAPGGGLAVGAAGGGRLLVAAAVVLARAGGGQHAAHAVRSDRTA